jgi:acetyltransferase
MTIRNLSSLLHPRSVALVGASGRESSLGAAVLRNILSRNFPGPIYAVNPHQFEQPGVHWVASIESLPRVPDLAIVVTPAETVPRVIAELGAEGCKCAVVMSAGITEANGLRQAMLDAARPHLLRIIGPNCLGVIAPRASLDATFARTPAKAGRLALISQSGALVTAILDWADARGIGFSGIVSVGDMADVDLGDLVDLFAVDPATDAILLYLEGVTNPAKFLSAARAAALGKPVIAIKAGRSQQAAKAAFSHTGALAGSYEVYRAAFERSGIILVDTLTELFDAAEMLCRFHGSAGDRIGIVSNGGGAGILAVDALGDAGAILAPLMPCTIDTLDATLPPDWSRANPVDLVGDAGAGRYRDAVRALLRDETVDALLVMHCPTSTASARDIASTLIAEIAEAAHAAHCDKPVIACWLGETNAASARHILADAEVPLFTTPDAAVRAFGYLLAARTARRALTDAPAASRDIVPNVEEARRIIDAAHAEKRTVLSEIEAKALLQAYHVPTVPTRFAAAVEAVGEACGWLKPPFVLKIVSPDISHKSDVGGVVLNLPDRKAAAAAACAMEMHISQACPDARLVGFAVEEMCERHGAFEMITGIATDPTFGPLLMVGAGGTAVEILADKALALAPIDHAQARELIGRTRIAKQLNGYRGNPAADVDAVAAVLDALSAIAVDLPDVEDLDINPLLVDATGAIALDARIRIASEPQVSRLVLRPAPKEWATTLVTQGGTHVFVRPVRADDEPLLAEFFKHVSPEDLRFRFLSGVSSVDHDRLAMMTRVDYRRTISFLAFDDRHEQVIATAMLAADPDRTRAEVALTTRSDMKHKGLSWALFEHVLKYAKAERIGTVEAIECADNEAALRMEREMGFTVVADPDDPALKIVRRESVPITTP